MGRPKSRFDIYGIIIVRDFVFAYKRAYHVNYLSIENMSNESKISEKMIRKYIKGEKNKVNIGTIEKIYEIMKPFFEEEYGFKNFNEYFDYVIKTSEEITKDTIDKYKQEIALFTTKKPKNNKGMVVIENLENFYREILVQLKRFFKNFGFDIIKLYLILLFALCSPYIFSMIAGSNVYVYSFLVMFSIITLLPYSVYLLIKLSNRIDEWSEKRRGL